MNKTRATPEPLEVSESPAIQLRNVSKAYETKTGRIEAVEGVSFSVEQGMFVSLIGPSGCGKSTLLKMVAGLIPYRAGEINVLSQPARPGRDDIGIMLQSPVLFPWRDVMENTLLPAELKRWSDDKARTKAREVLSLVGLEGFEDKLPPELSGGMQQRVSLSRSLMLDPSIVLMDEPFSALDEFTRERLNAEIAALHERLRRTFLFVTHKIQEAVFLSDEVLVMSARPGRIAGSVEVPLGRPRTLDMLDSDELTQTARKIRTLLRDA